MELRDQIHTALTDPAYVTAWDRVRDVEGWMTKEQGALLFARAGAVGASGRIVEIGSYRGRSTTILASAATGGAGLVAIDPHAGNDRGPQQWNGSPDEGQADHDAFWANLRGAGVAERVTHVREFSQQAHDVVPDGIDLLYVDGAHGYAPAVDDLDRWGDKVAPGGTMIVHDCYSSIGVTLALLRTMVADGRWRYLGRTRSMAAWERTAVVGVSARAANVGAQLAPLGWFARNVVVKAAIVSKVRPVARALGSDGETWPY